MKFQKKWKWGIERQLPRFLDVIGEPMKEPRIIQKT
jgi:hypothetical protein